MTKNTDILVYAVIFLACIACLESAYSQNVQEHNWVNQEDLMVDVRGTVQDAQGEPVAGAVVRFVDPQTLFDSEFQPTSTVTDKDGKFHLRYNIVDAFRHFLFVESKESNLAGFFSFTFEFSNGNHPLYRSVGKTELNSTGKVVSTPVFTKELLENIAIPVRKSQVVTGRVVDADDNPVKGAYAGVRYLYVGNGGLYGYVDFPGAFTDAEGQFTFLAVNQTRGGIYAVHKEKGIGNMQGFSSSDANFAAFEFEKHLLRLAQYPTRVRLTDQNTGEPRTDMLVRPQRLHYYVDGNNIPFYAVPDENGVALLPWTAPAQSYEVFDSRTLRSDFTMRKEHRLEETEIFVKNHPTKVYGQIQFPDGKPAAGFRIVYTDALHREYTTNAYNQTWSDSQGRYEIDIFSGIGSGIKIDTFSIYLYPEIPGWVPSELPVGRFPADGKPFRFDITLRKPTVIRGTLTKNHRQHGKTPEAGMDISLEGCLDRHWQMSGGPMLTEHWIQKTNEKGEFRFEVGPGFYSLNGDNCRIGEHHIAVDSQEEIVIDLEMPRNDMSGTVVDATDDRKPVVGIEVGVPKLNNSFDFGSQYSTEAFPLTKTDAAGKFQFTELNDGNTMFLAKDTEKNLYGLTIVSEPKENIEIAVASLQNGTGRLIRAEDGKPLANYEFRVQAVRIQEPVEGARFRNGDLGFPAFRGTTDTDGKFECSGLIYGVDYSLRLQPKDPDGWGVRVNFTESDGIHLFRVDKPEDVRLHNISVPRSKYEPTGSQMHNATMVSRNFMEKLSRAQEIARRNNQKIVLLLTWINTMPHHYFLQTFYDDPDVRTVSQHYQLLIGDYRRSSDWDKQQFAPIAEKMGIKPDDATEPTLLILDVDGKMLEMVPFESLREKNETDQRSDKTDPAKLIELMQKYLVDEVPFSR